MKKVLKSNCCSVKVLTIITLALLVVLIGVLVLSFYGIPRIIDTQIDASVRLKSNTEQWDRFQELPIPIITKIFMYNVTNADDVLNGATPKLVETGPYVFKQKYSKNILNTNENEDSVTYEQHIEATFDPDLSGNLTLNDTVVMVNAPLLVLTQMSSSIEQLVTLNCLDKIFPAEYSTLFITAQIHTLMFEGYLFAQNTADLGYACSIVRSLVIEKSRSIRNIQRIYNEDKPDVVEALKFSFLGFKIQKPDGVYTVNRGIADVTKLGTIMQWNYSTHLPFWGTAQSINNDTCQLVRGSDSTLYPPKIHQKKNFEIFSTDICRSVNIFYKGEGSYKGITGRRYEPDTNTFRSNTANDINDCFCTEKTLNKYGKTSCFLNGVLDVYECFGVPLLLSMPHFLYADESYINGIEGVSPPDPEIHAIYLLVEPNTGTPLQGKKRVQINLVLRPIQNMPFTRGLNGTVLPVLWLEEGADLTDDLIDMLNSKFFNLVKIANGVKYGLIAVSAAGVLVSGVILLRKMVLKW